jgi:uncharacterized membrane protein (DUF2068 family)
MGIFAGIGGILLLVAGYEFSLHSGTSSAGPEELGLLITLWLGYGFLGFSAAAPIILGIVYLITATGLFLGRHWVWSLSIILVIVSIGLNLGQEVLAFPIGLFGWVALLISFVILYYLTRPFVRQFFRTQSEV